MVTLILIEGDKQPKRRPRAEQILYEFTSRFFNLLIEPRNRYELGKALHTNTKVIEAFINKHISIGNITQPIYNPNKYMLTMKGRNVLYLITKLNEFITIFESNIILPLEKTGRK